MKRKVVILGAGLAGLSLARALLKRQDINCDVKIIEQEPYIGGLSASFKYDDLIFDYGSHRLHPSAPSYVFDDIGSLLGGDLLKRRRNGRIYLDNRFVRFPIKLSDAAFHLPLEFVAGTIRDSIQGLLRRPKNDPESFAEAVERKFGKTLCESFYFPYARKLWGLLPDEISKEQASRRVSAKSPFHILRKTISSAFEQRLDKSDWFYYPRKGFSQIAEAFADDIRRTGRNLRISTTVRGIHLKNNRVSEASVCPAENLGQKEVARIEMLPANFVFSTIPLNNLVQILNPQAPHEVIQAAKNLRYRGIIFVYLILQMQQFTSFDAHYFPNTDVIFARLSEPKNYSGATSPADTTGLCAEIPCDNGDETWNMPDNEIIKKVINDLGRVGFPLKQHIKTAFVRRLPNVYPVYDLNFRTNLDAVNDYLDRLAGVVSLGRQGFFLHNNIHNSIGIAMKACDILGPGLSWDIELWKTSRKRFENEVVLD